MTRKPHVGKEVDRACFELPFPVPLAACFIKSKGGSGIPSERYKAYEREAWGMMLQAGSPRVSGPVSVHFTLCAPDRRKSDGDNLLKCLFDTLTHNGVIEDDNNAFVRHFSLEWIEQGQPCQVVVERYRQASVPFLGIIE